MRKIIHFWNKQLNGKLIVLPNALGSTINFSGKQKFEGTCRRKIFVTF
jgi:hypothetical protein